ncbi:MAG: hypothetical protein ABR507_11990, partial [Actinomycetota bacterium]
MLTPTDGDGEGDGLGVGEGHGVAEAVAVEPGVGEPQGTGDGESTWPPIVGAVKLEALMPFNATCMNSFHIVAGNVPPVTRIPC